MVNSVKGVEQSAAVEQTAQQQAPQKSGVFAELLAEQLSKNTAYVEALTNAAASSGLDSLAEFSSLLYNNERLSATEVKQAEAEAMLAAREALYGPAYAAGTAQSTALKKAEAEALQAARELLLVKNEEEREAAAQAEEAEQSDEENMLSSLFGGNVSTSEALMLFCLMLSSSMGTGGMGSDSSGSGGMSGMSGMSGGMSLMLSSLMGAMATRSAREQEELRYGLLTDGYKSSNASEVLDDAVTYVNEAVFSGTSEASYPYRASKPTEPIVQSTADSRSAENYAAVIEQFQVAANPRYAANKKGTGDTYSNTFLWDVTSAMGAEIPYYTNGDTGEVLTYPNVDGANTMTANRMYDWLAETGGRYGWQEVTAAQAQAYANAGMPTVAVWQNPTGGSGHCQIVRPAPDTAFDPARGVAIAQAGRTLLNAGYMSDVYASGMPDVKYYAHA